MNFIVKRIDYDFFDEEIEFLEKNAFTETLGPKTKNRIEFKKQNIKSQLHIPILLK
ncbi:conserved hypothetical protein [Treponema phagedenis]|uniref:Uncharacterized protein n=1 Tax=Treponema phagedenis TaxID=162 RepID=A0A0B7GVV0_TREPH|nr:conserved hypothetical protein [Treponema phagedenis]